MILPKHHLLTIEDLSTEDIRCFLDEAKRLRELLQKGKPLNIFSGKTIVHLFYEASTRTRASFEIAAKNLGANTLQLSPSDSTSINKGESLLDMAKTMEAMQPAFLVIRHSSSGVTQLLAEKLHTGIINAGDGFHAHPSQALLDAFTIEDQRKEIKGLQVSIIGDIAHSRVARSNIQLLKKLGAKVLVCGPPTLVPEEVEKLGVERTYSMREALEKADVLMLLRIQFERQNAMQIPSEKEYHRFFGLNEHNIKYMKKDAILMHPGPINRGLEISSDLAYKINSVILNQVTNGVFVRMGIFSILEKNKEKAKKK